MGSNMKNVYLLMAFLLAGCASGSASQVTPETAPPPDEQKGAPTEVAEDSGRDEPAETNEAEVADQTVECQTGGTVSRPNATLRAGEYINVQVGKACDVLTVHAERAHTIHQSLRTLDDARQLLGEDNVELVIGTEATVYQSREELLSDPDAGAEAAAVLPQEFDFETSALARYDVLHSSWKTCRDARLGMTGEQARARDESQQEWREKAQRLADEWRFVPDAVDTVRNQQVIDPVLPAERTYPASGPCQVSWIKQPALTPVPRDTAVRVYYGSGSKVARARP